VLLALLSLSLSLLLWLNGLSGSLERPSVEQSLDRRQLELAVLVEDRLPSRLRQTLVGEAPRQQLIEALEQANATGTTPAPAARRLELALLQRTGGGGAAAAEAANRDLRDLIPSVEPARRSLLEALLAGRRLNGTDQRALLQPWSPSPVLRQLSCEQLGGGTAADPCPADRRGSGRVLQLLAVTLLPLLLLLLGVGLLIRSLWQRLSGRQLPAPPLVGPPLSPVDVTLLIAGAFVLVGELLVPTLLEPPLKLLINQLALSGPLAEGVRVLVLYLGLMVAPLGLLVIMLRGSQATIPMAGWLQWRWKPLASATRQATRLLLMLLPAVALAGWLVGRIWGDPGGSNPLLELVLNSGSPWGLACFALTAVVLAPLFEETLFRGVLLPVLGQRVGGTAAVLISAAVFALAHLSLGELMPLFVLGIGLGLLRWSSGRLATSVIAHGLWNGLTFANLLLLANGPAWP
jgi:membrane protease YdiL (CAAX protease family)